MKDRATREDPKHRTFSYRIEASRPHVIRSMLDEVGVVVIQADPTERDTPEGKVVGAGFPVLIVTGWVAREEEFAAKVVELLNGAGLL